MSTYTTHFAPTEPIVVRRSSYAQKKNELSFLSLLLHAKNAKIAELLLVIETKDAKIETKDAVIKTKDAKLVLYEKENRMLSSLFQNDNQTIKEMFGRIKIKNNMIEEQNNMIKEQKDMIKEQKDMIDRLKAKMYKLRKKLTNG